MLFFLLFKNWDVTFHASSGLKVNFSKSKVFGIGVSPSVVSAWASPLGCEPASLPFSYLGVPVGKNMNLKKAWKPVIDRFKSKLSAWKSKTLSFGGRVTLAKSVLGSLPTYFLSLFKSPLGVIEDLERIRRKFIWSGTQDSKGINWVSWEKVTSPKEVGGLGLGSLRSLNISFLTKWWWRLRLEQNALWARIIMAIHCIANLHDTKIAKSSMTGTWKNIASMKKALVEMDIPPPHVIHWNEESGTWRSNFDGEDGYSVSRLRIRLDRAPHHVCDSPFLWPKVVPLKINCFVWRARIGRIPSLLALKKRGVIIDDSRCGFCSSADEDADHVLVNCPLASQVLSAIWSWCKV